MDRIGNLDDLPSALRSQLRNKAAKPGPEQHVIEALKKLDGVATTDELMVQQYRLFKIIPEGRRQFMVLLYRMKERNLIARKGSGIWALVESNGIKGAKK